MPSRSYDYYEYSQADNGYIPKTSGSNVDTENFDECIIKFDTNGRLTAVWYHSKSTSYSVNSAGYPYAETLSYDRVANVIITYDNIGTITMPAVKTQDK